MPLTGERVLIVHCLQRKMSYLYNYTCDKEKCPTFILVKKKSIFLLSFILLQGKLSYFYTGDKEKFLTLICILFTLDTFLLVTIESGVILFFFSVDKGNCPVFVKMSHMIKCLT